MRVPGIAKHRKPAGIKTRGRPPAQPPPWLRPPGTVFLGFAFNWVDAGGLLGGRLGDDIIRVPVRASAEGVPLLAGPGAAAVAGATTAASAGKAGKAGREVKRAHTM